MYGHNGFGNKIQTVLVLDLNDSLLFTPEVDKSTCTQNPRREKLTMTINTRNKIQTPLSSSLLKSVLTDLYTESKERD